jgi:hypothetical protein
MMSKPYKQLFVGRKWDDIFKLPAQAMQIWLYHYRCENRIRESWPTEQQICEACNINRKTLYKWRRYLIDNEWLEQLSFARSMDIAGRWIAPSFKVRHGIIPLQQEDKRANNRLPKLGTQSQTLVSQVDVMGSGFGSSSDFNSSFAFDSSSSSRYGRGENQSQKPEPSALLPQNQNQNPTPPVPVKSVKSAKDGTPYPDNFDQMDNTYRLTWLALHNPEVKDIPVDEQKFYCNHLCKCGEVAIAQLDQPFCSECAPRCHKHPDAPAIDHNFDYELICKQCSDKDQESLPRMARGYIPPQSVQESYDLLYLKKNSNILSANGSPAKFKDPRQPAGEPSPVPPTPSHDLLSEPLAASAVANAWDELVEPFNKQAWEDILEQPAAAPSND